MAGGLASWRVAPSRSEFWQESTDRYGDL
ncbi:MAG TPA: hypothetical protein HPQ00_04515 [Magnetococcales bacterium]|nr:hypothetical protein [Magnetococcales bacterium]